MAIEQGQIIDANDIQDLSVNTVTANVYNGTKFTRTSLLQLESSSMTSGYVAMNDSYNNYEFLEVFVVWGNGTFSHDILSREEFANVSYLIDAREYLLNLSDRTNTYYLLCRLSTSNPVNFKISSYSGVQRLIVNGLK